MMLASLTQTLRTYVLYIAWGQAAIATSLSLYFSEVELYAPCMLCWYQRITMYPLVIILIVGILRRDTNVWYYAMPLAVIGWILALYHNFLYYGFLPESDATCRAGVSCTTEYIEWFGFITIPLLSFVAFSVIIAALLYYRRIQSND